MRNLLRVSLFGLCLIALNSLAAIDTFEFQTEAERERFRTLVAELRCPKCQNQNLADSDSAIAKDLRTEVYRMVSEGENNDQIIDFMVSRYGEFVLYRPKFGEQTYLLWGGPLLLLIAGFAVLLMIVRKRKAAEPDALLNEQQQARLADLLENKDSK